MKIIATAVALVCAGTLSPSLAQTAKAKAPAERNLQIEASAAPTVNNAQRVALVIGNSAYKDAPLTNPVNDARAIARALQESGFTVISRENIDQGGMLAALREFGDRLRGGGTGLFYYAGHGMQIKGRNYLIPVGASIEREDEVAYNAVDAQAVLDKMEAAGNVANIMILDACRNNPFTRSTRSGQAGLAQMDAPVGTLVAYATSPGAVASDGSGSNGLYTQHLLTAIRQPGSKVEDVFKQVRANVRRDSQGKQVPWESTSLEGDFYFKGGAPLLAVPLDSGSAVESALWDAVKASSLSIEIRAYLNRYPAGQFAAQARAQLVKLQPVAVLAPAPAPAVAPVKATETGASAVAGSFLVGDSWSFVSDNLLTQKKTAFTQKVTAFYPNGDLMVNDGAQVFNASGQVKYIRNAERDRFYSDGFRLVPSQLRPGFKEPVSYEILSKLKDGRETKFAAEGTIEALRQEKVTTPAGIFMAWRISRQSSSVLSNGNALVLDHNFWFVPELKRVVAHDLTETNTTTGKTTLRERQALQSFTLVDPTAHVALKANSAQAASQVGGADFIKTAGATAVAGADDSDQAAVNQRTTELLASLASQAPVTSAAAPAKAARPKPSSNASGFTVGDRWRYQKVDSFKQEVVLNWGRTIDAINADGSIKLNGGSVDWAVDGAVKSERGSDGSLMAFSPANKWLPGTLKAGYSEPLKHTLVWRKSDGRHGTEERDGTVKVLAQETVKVPAGEFNAWKIEFSGFANGNDLSKNSAYVVRFKSTFWYVPALRNYVANEFEQRDNHNHIQFNERHELTSFSVRGAESFAGR